MCSFPGRHVCPQCSQDMWVDCVGRSFRTCAGSADGTRSLRVAEMRWRILGGPLYAPGTGETQLFPETVGTLRPGAYASVGLGADNAR